MPIVGAAAITGAAVVGGAVVANKGQKAAAKAQENAAREAIAYQERTQRERQGRYDTAYADYRKRYDAYMEQFYGVKPSGGGGNGVHASAAGGGAPPSMGSMAPPVSPVRQGDTIADLIRNIGGIRANAASASGNTWGNALATAGTGIGTALKNRPPTPPPPQATVTGSFQPTGVSPAEAGINPNAFNDGGWSNWDNYLYSGGARP